ncbi:MAG: hypothetical protein IKY66_09935 [Bacteroidales bacterium]|nr:hypothetical protein [Bacteroidales bacterium]
MKRVILTIVISLLLPVCLNAQFYLTGDDPGRVKWYTVETDNFSIIYPEGTDSLAREYGYSLEKFRKPVSRSTGYLNKGKMPVVMHAYNDANGSVAWAPKRMDLFTIPSPYAPEPMPWSTMLSVHEGRHVTQMQFGMTQAQKPFGWAFGEMWNILASLIYPGLSNIEGDAVIAETALTNSGRGRTADFLNYYKVAFDNGDFRRWDQWRLGSQRRYAPDHYALGYLTIGGFRYLYDCPEFMKEAYELSARRPYNLAAFYTTAKKATGKKFEEAFQDVCHTMHDIWVAEAEARAPFIPMEAVTEEPRLYADYRGTVILDNTLYSIKSGHETTPLLVTIDSLGKEKKVSRFAYQTSDLKASQKKLYWSETSADPRWSLKSQSGIRYAYTGETGKRKLTDTGRLLYNPAVNEDGTLIATVEYLFNGNSLLTVINAADGKEQSSVKGPSGIQLVEAAWAGKDILATGISDQGYGIYRFADGQWSVMLAPQPVKIQDFKKYGDEIIFTCDRTGVNELYHLDPSTGALRQKTVTRYGASDFAYDDEGRYLYYSSQTVKGMQIFRTAVEDLVDREADFTQKHEWVLAEALAEQEKVLAAKDGFNESVTEPEVNFSQPERYRKFPHMFNVHSWAPLYVNVDRIMNMAYDQTWQAASLGATGIIQNRLSNASGEFGYSAHKDQYDPSKWRHSGHARFTYSGLYPVIEAKVDFNDRAARQYNVTACKMDKGTSLSISSRALNTPYIEGNVSMYIPWSFSSGGWHKGLIPKLTYRISNDKFNTSMVVTQDQGDFCSFLYSTEGKNTFRHSLSGSLRAYTMLSTPNSAVYPKWGIGAEAGAYGNLESSEYLSPMGYGYLYGYVPGLMATHGIKLSAMHQIKLSDAPFGQALVNILPRGFSGGPALLSWLSIHYSQMTRLTADYAFPIFIGDPAIGGNIFSIKRLVVNPHFDYTFAGGYGLFSAGAELILDMNSILTLEWPCSFGITYSYNGGTGFNVFAQQSGASVGRHYVGPTFNVSF